MYSELYFGKGINELNIQDIEQFFQEEKEESDKIEFKSYTDEYGNVKEKEFGILKTICSFLNSEGGLLIWGAPAGTPHKEDIKRKIFTGLLTSFITYYEKDKFINKITDSITPVANAIQFQRIESAGKYVYVFEVAKSPYSPHQFQNIYYMRLDGQTVKAPHHYIEALFKKISYPRLGGYMHIQGLEKHSISGDFDKTRIRLHLGFYVFNFSKLQNEFNVSYRILTDSGEFPHSHDWHIPTGSKHYPTSSELILGNVKKVLYYGEPALETDTIDVVVNASDSNPIVGVYFFFGGKFSPLMLSSYKISLSNVTPSTNYNHMLSTVQENKYVHEIDTEGSLSEKEKLKLILGR